MTVEAYITPSRTAGKPISNAYLNGVDHTLRTAPDGWVTIIERNLSRYAVLLQASNRAKAIEYIVRREPLPVAVNIL